jgi:hexokinase
MRNLDGDDHPTKAGRRAPLRPRPIFSPHHKVLCVLVLLLVLALQLVAPHLPTDLLVRFGTSNQVTGTKPAVSLREAPFYKEPPVCPKPPQRPAPTGTFNTHPKRSMALAEQSKRVAAEFGFGADAVNKAVKEFRREMGMSKHP